MSVSETLGKIWHSPSQNLCCLAYEIRIYVKKQNGFSIKYLDT